VSMAFICIYVCVTGVRMRICIVNGVGIHICMCQCRRYAYMHVSMAFIRTYECIHGVHMHICMGWLRLVGSIQLYVSFAECSLFGGALFQKRHII